MRRNGSALDIGILIKSRDLNKAYDQLERTGWSKPCSVGAESGGNRAVMRRTGIPGMLFLFWGEFRG